MTTQLRIERAGPSATVQDAGRFGMLQHGIGASGPMDRGAFARGGMLLGHAGSAGIEFTQAGLAFTLQAPAPLACAFTGGSFALKVNGEAQRWESAAVLAPGDSVDITPGPSGNYGYMRFNADIDVPPLLGSRSTSLVAGLGGFAGRALRAGDLVPLEALAGAEPSRLPSPAPAPVVSPVAFRVIWGIHADLFPRAVRAAFVDATFAVTPRLDRMGVRLADPAKVLAGAPILSLVSDAIVAGDIQVLGDGTPIVLMRDHQPTGGYPRIATIISADLDRFAQLRPGSALAFEPVTLHKARALYLASLAG